MAVRTTFALALLTGVAHARRMQKMIVAQHRDDVPVFNNSVCPAFWELQAPHVASTLKHEDYEGYFHELAFHDITQYPLCPNKVPRCVTAEKAIETHADGTLFVNDTWNLNCFGQPYPQELLFNLTEHPGFVLGYVPTTKIPFLPESVVAGATFPNTVVDFKSGPEGWLLEMQCVDASLARLIGKKNIAFVGINFYSKVDSEEAYQEIFAAARARGLGLWLDNDFKTFRGGVPGISRVNNTGCPDRRIHKYDSEGRIIKQ